MKSSNGSRNSYGDAIQVSLDVSDEETIESCSSKSAWILAVSILVVAFLGVGAGIGLSFLNGSDEPISKNVVCGDVSLSDRECDIVRDTVVGTVDIDIDIYCNEDLPLCLTADYLNEKWSATAAISGYHINWTVLVITQKNELKGYIYIYWGEPVREPCWTDYYTGYFVLLDVNQQVVDYIALDSSYWPDGAEPLCSCDSELIPDKEVYLTKISLLRGCVCEDQHFYLNGETTTKLVEKGWICVDYNIPDPMDLCLTADDLAEWSGTMYISGYDPVDGTIEVWQKGELLGIVNVEWTFVEQVPCYYDVYTATFTMDEDYIAIYSNQWPDGAIPYDPDCTCCTIPGKEVILKPVNLYKGCDCENQMFLKIMAHEIRITRVPNS